MNFRPLIISNIRLLWQWRYTHIDLYFLFIQIYCQVNHFHSNSTEGRHYTITEFMYRIDHSKSNKNAWFYYGYFDWIIFLFTLDYYHITIYFHCFDLCLNFFFFFSAENIHTTFTSRKENHNKFAPFQLLFLDAKRWYGK